MLEPHDVEWTREKVERFWDDYANRRDAELYFSAQYTRALADFIERRAKPGRGRLIDLGCGNGVLLAEMARRGYMPLGIDSSVESLREAAARIGDANVMSGSVTQVPVEDRSSAGLLLIETIEHVLDEDLTPMMHEITRVLRSGSPLVVTTPNSEALEAAKVTCPDCAATFHPMQHVRSWTADSLEAFLRSHGFRGVRTYETRLAPGAGLQQLARSIVYRWRGDRSHLIAVAIA
jgi:2-polyprenyl-3-methyl-5-hydroxy-6-metoxy-1,4-benzoquinol methylase